MEVNNGNESDSMEEIEKQRNPKVVNFSFNEPSSGLKDGETSIDRTLLNIHCKNTYIYVLLTNCSMSRVWHNFQTDFNRFELRVFLLLDWLPHKS